MKWGDIKRILREATSTEDPNVINYSSEKTMVDAAYKRLVAHADECMGNVGRDHYFTYLDATNRGYNLVLTHIHLLPKRKGSYTRKSPSIQVAINLDPINHVVKVVNEWEHPPKRLIQKVCAEVDLIISPVPTNDGLWWADENYYPLRPMWQGETVDKKPRKTWTVVNAATGEVLVENTSHGDEEATYNPDNIDTLREAALDRIRAWCEQLEASDEASIAYLDGGFYEDEGQSVYVEESNEKRSMFKVVLSDPTAPNAVIERSVTGNAGVKRDAEWIQQTIEKLTDLAVPTPAADGTWWADENFYSIRPVWEGEDTNLKPKAGWTVIDGASGNVIKESRGNDRNALGLNPKSVDAVRLEIMERMLAKLGSAEQSDAPGSKAKAASQYTLVLMEDDPDGGPMQPAGPHAMNLVVFDDNVGEATVGIQVDLTDPLKGMVDVVDSWADADEEVIEGYIDELSEDMRPEASTSGLWWGDADFYPIRPLFAGEDPKLKPMPSCTVVDGTTGDVVSEGTEHKVDVINPKCNNDMLVMALERLRKWCNARRQSSVDEAYVDGGVNKDDSVSVVVHETVDDAPTAIMVKIHLDDVMRPHAVLHKTYSAKAGSVIDAWIERMFETLEEVASPHADERGWWWADEDYYPIRPLYQGEDYVFKPDPSWTLVDGKSGDVVVTEAAPKKRKKDVGRITKAAESGMYNKAFERMVAVEKRLKDEGYHVEFWMEHTIGNSMHIRTDYSGKQPNFGSRGVVFDIRNALTAAIHDVDEADPREKYLYDLVKDAIEPHTHPSGAWWVDENMYLTRAIYDGEPFDSPPYKEWTAVDPETYDPVSV